MAQSEPMINVIRNYAGIAGKETDSPYSLGLPGVKI